MKFELVADYKPFGDQPKAIERLVSNLKLGIKEQTLLGATGTGKTFTIANVIREINTIGASGVMTRASTGTGMTRITHNLTPF